LEKTNKGKELKMTALSQALEDVKNYLGINGVRNIKVEYGTETDYKTSKSVTITFQSGENDVMVNVVNVPMRNSENDEK
tara:strand:+ start:365 stop:601 length:237 start_codon:yes stop_codon:yes gene_type:complete